MIDLESGSLLNLILWAGLTLLVWYVYKIFNGTKKEEAPTDDTNADSWTSGDSSETVPAAENWSGGKAAKKRTAWKSKSEFEHPWLLKNLKGHTATVLHVDISANGKFLATSCEERQAPSPADSPPARRRKQRERRRPPPAPPAPSPPPPPPARLPPDTLHVALSSHVLTRQRMWELGYPLEVEPNSCKAVLYVHPPPRPRARTVWDVNAPEFVPGGSSSDSGRGSAGSSPRSDSDEEADTVEHGCVRCDATFRVSRDGDYLTLERCLYHWGRLDAERRFACCGGVSQSRGCTTARLHVWNGTKPGMNGPLDGYVRARSRRGGVYAIDAEMCYTTAGLELASVAVVGADGRLVYRAAVKPRAPVIDCNTRFSGLRQRDIDRATKSLRDVQNDVLGFVGTDTILVGHALENDLRALKLLHGAVVDTCALYPHARGFPLRRSLRALAAQHLGRAVQAGPHSPLEDARAALDLALVRAHEELAAVAASDP